MPARSAAPAASPTAPSVVLDLRDSPWVDGPGRTILDTASGIDPRFRIVVGAFVRSRSDEHSYLAEAERRGLSSCAVVERRALDLEVLSQIVACGRSVGARLIHSHDFRSDLYGLVAARRLAIPAVATCHGWIANNVKGRIYTAIDRRLLRRFDRVIAVSGRMRGQLVVGGVSPERIAVVPNALIVENFVPRRGATDLRAEWGVQPGQRLIGNIGRLSPEKRQDLLLEAVARLLPACPDLAVVLVGIGPEEQRLRALAKHLGIAAQVVFAGYREDMRRVYDNLDLVVQSSRTEGMPNVILEASLMRVPVVATDVGGTAEIVTDGQTGRLVPPEDPAALANAMREVLADPAHAARLAEAGERHVRAGFSHAARLRQIAAVYDAVLSR